MGVTRTLAQYAASGGFDDLPPDVVEHAKVAVLNILGASLGGFETHIGKLHLSLARKTGGGCPEATLIGDGEKISTAMAAYANSSLAFALDYEDVVLYTIHAGPVTIPAALAVGQLARASGKEFLIAIERGYEIGTRIGLAMQPSAERGAQVWGQQYTPFAACIAASRLLGLSAEETDVAVGVTGTYAAVPSAYKYFGVVGETRPMREVKLGWGWMALGGTFGALSAKEGFRGGHGILDGDEGFWIMAGSDQCDHEKMVENLGDTHLICETEYKVHPSIAWNHPPHTALKSMMAENGFSADDVERVLIKGLGAERIADYRPSGSVDAMFSLPYTVATTLLGDRLLPAMYEDSRIASTEVKALLSRTHIQPDQEAELAWFNEHRMCFSIDVELKDGRRLHVDTEYPRDKPDIGWSQIEDKFRELADLVVPSSRADEIIGLVQGLEDLDDVSILAESLAP